MLTQAARFKTFQLLQSISENEEIVEEQRQQLAKQHGFEPWAAFKRIDRMQLGKISAYDINQFLHDNMVDYISETECFHMFTYFDKDEDGFLDFQDFLQMVLPMNNIALRAKVSQRQNYAIGENGRLQTNVEFELSRLFEKEIHYHVKIEIEKKALEAMDEFNTVSVFSVIDSRNFGFLDFENIKNYLFKFKQEILKEDVNAILRRLSDQPDGKINFREFSLAITPNLVGLSNEALNNVEFGLKEKERLAQIEMNKSFTHTKENSCAKQSLRSFRTIQGQGHDSPVRQEFKMLNLRQQEDPDTQYVMDMVKMGSPSKDDSVHRRHSRKVLKSEHQTPILHNDVRGEDLQFDQCWEDTIHGRATREEDESMMDTANQANIQVNSSGVVHNNARHSEPPQFKASQQKESVWGQRNTSHSAERVQNNYGAAGQEQMGPIDRDFQPQFDKSAKQPRRNGVTDRAHTTIQNLFTVISEQEMEIEKLRQRLVGESPEFNVVDAFRRLDSQAKGQVSSEQLHQALVNEIGVQFDKYELDLFFLHFDKEQKGFLKYSEFCEAFVPKSQQCQLELQARKAQNLKNLKTYNQMFSEHTRQLYAALWDQILQAEMQIEQERQLLLQNPNFDVQKAFALFESINEEGTNNGFITREDLSCTLMLSDPHTDILFHKFNRRQPGVINYAEFIEEVSPKGPLL